MWIAESFLDLEESTAEAYAKDLLAMNLEEKGDGNLIAAVLNRVDAAGGDLSEHCLRKKIDALMAVAIRVSSCDAV
ncbi:MAG: ATPase inhibitor subunit zeta [Pseudomonadota bacterium]|nr:ATPase inhibitor subunit zeta [Pseudomonadota bacterium]